VCERAIERERERKEGGGDEEERGKRRGVEI